MSTLLLSITTILALYALGEAVHPDGTGYYIINSASLLPTSGPYTNEGWGMSHLDTDNICFFCMAGPDGIAVRCCKPKATSWPSRRCARRWRSSGSSGWSRWTISPLMGAPSSRSRRSGDE
jgi:hypothetical protein